MIWFQGEAYIQWTLLLSIMIHERENHALIWIVVYGLFTLMYLTEMNLIQIDVTSTEEWYV